MPKSLSPQLYGLIVTLAGVLVIVPDSLMIRLIDGHAFTIIFFRSGLSCLVVALACFVFGWWRRLGRAALIFAVVEAMGSFLFVVALENTSVAAALFLISTAPILSALLSWAVLGERLELRMIWTIFGALVGIALIASGTSDGAPQQLLGNLAALGVALSLAIAFTTVRHTPELPVVPALALAYALASLSAAYIAPTLLLPSEDWIWVMLNGGIFVPLGFALLSIGPRYITAAEVSLILLLEAVLAPILVWAVLGENPGSRTLIGGAIVLAVLLVSNLIALRTRR